MSSKHGISFETATRVFADPFALIEQDRIENGEFQHVVQNPKKESAMSKTIHYELDLNKLPPLTKAQKAEIKALAKMPDKTIDYSDIPPLDDDFWKNAVKNPFYKPTKTSTTVRVDSDILVWLKSQGKGYQTRINLILREAMIRALHQKA
jgi:uncharacterized protein (DUF4415 family)